MKRDRDTTSLRNTIYVFMNMQSVDSVGIRRISIMKRLPRRMKFAIGNKTMRKAIKVEGMTIMLGAMIASTRWREINKLLGERDTHSERGRTK